MASLVAGESHPSNHLSRDYHFANAALFIAFDAFFCQWLCFHISFASYYFHFRAVMLEDRRRDIVIPCMCTCVILKHFQQQQQKRIVSWLYASYHTYMHYIYIWNIMIIVVVDLGKLTTCAIPFDVLFVHNHSWTDIQFRRAVICCVTDWTKDFYQRPFYDDIYTYVIYIICEYRRY